MEEKIGKPKRSEKYRRKCITKTEIYTHPSRINTTTTNKDKRIVNRYTWCILDYQIWYL